MALSFHRTHVPSTTCSPRSVRPFPARQNGRILDKSNIFHENEIETPRAIEGTKYDYTRATSHSDDRYYLYAYKQPHGQDIRLVSIGIRATFTRYFKGNATCSSFDTAVKSS